MIKFLAWTANTSPDSNIIFPALDFSHAKEILKTRLKLDTMHQEIFLMNLSTLETKNYFIERM
jgi:hypothetical protein